MHRNWKVLGARKFGFRYEWHRLCRCPFLGHHAILSYFLCYSPWESIASAATRSVNGVPINAPQRVHGVVDMSHLVRDIYGILHATLLTPVPLLCPSTNLEPSNRATEMVLPRSFHDSTGVLTTQIHLNCQPFPDPRPQSPVTSETRGYYTVSFTLDAVVTQSTIQQLMYVPFPSAFPVISL